jgi:zinc transport system substrate-binding protein
VFAKQIAANIADALIQRDPTKAELYRSNLAQLDSDLDAVHAKLEKILEPLKGRKFYVYHPAYGYFGARYGLKQVAIQSGGKEPTAKQVAKLITSAKKDGVRIIFVQPQFSQKTADAIAKEINGAVVPLDDLAKDYLKNFEDMAVKLERALIQ